MDIVLPGEIVAIEEEAIPLQGVYVDDKGNIRALIAGVVSIDRFKKTIMVRQLNKRNLTLKPGVIVEGKVINTIDPDLVFVYIYLAWNQRISAMGVIHISQVSSEQRAANINEYVRIGDHVRAKVLNSIPPYQLTIKDIQLGVIEAYCSVCGNILYRDGDRLVCKMCNNIERRKIATGYVYVLR
ncbi:MAG: exosome complex RNA-binding protein Csl4 [Desulfurococcaceae archaeon]